MSHFAPLPLQAVTITNRGDEAALIRPTGATPSGLRRLSPCLDAEPQNSHMVPTRENALTPSITKSQSAALDLQPDWPSGIVVARSMEETDVHRFDEPFDGQRHK
jgi:hypothetical protein